MATVERIAARVKQSNRHHDELSTMTYGSTREIHRGQRLETRGIVTPS